MNSSAVKSIIVEFVNKKLKNIILHLTYRPPNRENMEFENILKSSFRKWCPQKKLTITGDLTFDCLDFDKNAKVQSFLNLMFPYGLTSVVNKPTRVTRNSHSNSQLSEADPGGGARGFFVITCCYFFCNHFEELQTV